LAFTQWRKRIADLPVMLLLCFRNTVRLRYILTARLHYIFRVRLHYISEVRPHYILAVPI
jgi:hypothetical protein